MNRNRESFARYSERKQREHGAKWDASQLDRSLVPYFESGARIKVRIFDEVLTGTVGVTTGWRPAFLLMRTSRSMGSSDVLSPGSFELLAVQYGRKYYPVAK